MLLQNLVKLAGVRLCRTVIPTSCARAAKINLNFNGGGQECPPHTRSSCTNFSRRLGRRARAGDARPRGSGRGYRGDDILWDETERYDDSPPRTRAECTRYLLTAPQKRYETSRRSLPHTAKYLRTSRNVPQRECLLNSLTFFA